MAVFIVLYPYLLTTKLKTVIRHNLGHSKVACCHNLFFLLLQVLRALNAWFKCDITLELKPKLYTPSTLNIDLMVWHTQLIVRADNVKSWFKSRVFPLTFQAYILPHTLNCICDSLFKFHVWILEQFYCCKKQPDLTRHQRYILGRAGRLGQQ